MAREVDSGSREDHRPPSDAPFLFGMGALSGVYLALLASMLIAMVGFTTWAHIGDALASDDIRYAIQLSLISCTVTTVLSLWIAVPIGYLMSHYDFRGKNLLDAMLDIPIVLPPLVVGLGLLILFTTGIGRAFEESMQAITGHRFTYDIPGVILAQFMVACAFAVRTMRATFDAIDPRLEEVALTLGCSKSQAFWRVVFPECTRGMIVAATLAWARSLGEFGPLLVFAGATRGKTEVLPTTVFLELSVGNIEAAVAVSMIMILAAVAVLAIVRVAGRYDRAVIR